MVRTCGTRARLLAHRIAAEEECLHSAFVKQAIRIGWKLKRYERPGGLSLDLELMRQKMDKMKKEEKKEMAKTCASMNAFERGVELSALQSGCRTLTDREEVCKGLLQAAELFNDAPSAEELQFVAANRGRIHNFQLNQKVQTREGLDSQRMCDIRGMERSNFFELSAVKLEALRYLNAALVTAGLAQGASVKASDMQRKRDRIVPLVRKSMSLLVESEASLKKRNRKPPRNVALLIKTAVARWGFKLEKERFQARVGGNRVNVWQWKLTKDPKIVAIVQKLKKGYVRDRGSAP